MWLQLALNAFSLGSFYALIALGFSIIFGVTRALNLAHGEMMLVAGYLAYVLGNYWEIPFFWTLPACMLGLLFLAVLLRALLQYLGEPYELNSLVVTFGLALVLQNGMLFLFSADYRMIRTAETPWTFPSAHITLTQLQAWLISLSLLATFFVFLLLQKTLLGKALRATIQDREAASLAGIPVERMSVIAFALGGLLIGLAGPLYGCTAYLHPWGGMEATLIAIVITIFAGVGRIRAILLGGWALGLVESLTVIFLGTNWRELVSTLVLISLLILRPGGLPRVSSRLSRP
ncbi:MAG: branched-chain amino acid ABC transporter permease [Syntrophobacteraceae bacterium]|nr:branched-chain amino acid ABC transporter permease [Syntrophobacteraceae bacterium]